jgi:hypothetical protein
VGPSLASGAAEVLGLDVGVGVGVGLALVGVGVGVGLGLDDAGVGDGEVAGGVLAGVHGAGRGASTRLLGLLPGPVGVALPWVADGLPETAEPPVPLVFPGPLTLLEGATSGVFEFAKEANVS